MPSVQFPGVFVDEVPGGPRPIEGVGTGTTAGFGVVVGAGASSFTKTRRPFSVEAMMPLCCAEHRVESAASTAVPDSIDLSEPCFTEDLSFMDGLMPRRE